MRLEQPESTTRRWSSLGLVRGIGGAIVGGAVGYFVFAWIATMGFYAPVLPGALLGLGFGLASQQRNLAFGILCAIAALALGLFSEWSQFPFRANGSFSYFLTHLNQLKPVTWIMWVIGALMAFWFGRGR
jgi:ABC-type lipoprotein release transport system permease subunit